MSVLVQNGQEFGADVYRSRYRGKYSGRRVLETGVNSQETLEEYKERINQEINKIPFHSSHRKITETLVISEEGYQAMMHDPEYERWVLEHIRENRSVDMSIMTHNSHYISGTDYEYIGATKEECWGQGSDKWDFDKDDYKVSAKKKRKNNIAADGSDPLAIWMQAIERRDGFRKERNEQFFSHKAKSVRGNRMMAGKAYASSFMYNDQNV